MTKKKTELISESEKKYIQKLELRHNSIFICNLQYYVDLDKYECLHLPKKKTKKKSILFVGSSQTYGAGALTHSQNFAATATFYLNKRMENQFESYNMSVPGFNSSNLFPLMYAYIEKINPNLVVINLSNNDIFQPLEFESNIKSAVNFLKSKRIDVIFLKEANSSEQNSLANRLKENHLVLDKIKVNHQITVLDFNSYINSNEVYDSGLLWWDFIHLRHGGHIFTGKWLALELENFLRLKHTDR